MEQKTIIYQNRRDLVLGVKAMMGAGWQHHTFIRPRPALRVLRALTFGLINPDWNRFEVGYWRGTANWEACLAIENATQDQINALTLKIVDWCEEQGLYMGGGFMPEVEDGQEEGA